MVRGDRFNGIRLTGLFSLGNFLGGKLLLGKRKILSRQARSRKGIASGSKLRDVLKAACGSDIPILLAPFEERKLELIITVRDRTKVNDDDHINIKMHWRRSVSPRIPQWPVSVRTSLADIERRQKAAMNN